MEKTTTTTTTPSPTKPTTTPKKNKSKSFMASLLMSSPTSSSSSTSSSPTSFKEETHHLKSLQELKSSLSSSPHFSSTTTLWGISLLSPSPSLDVVLLKFLRARDFHVPDALSMLERCIDWRKDFGADSILDEDLSQDFKDLEGVVAYMSGFDRHGHPVCYNAYGVFRDWELYERVFGDEDKLRKFLRWRVQVLERGVALLHFKPGGINSMIQVTDLKDMPKRELRVASAQILSLFQDNYPEMVARKVPDLSLFFLFSFVNSNSSFPDSSLPPAGCLQIFINVPWYFSALYAMFSPFLTQRTKSKFVISREGYAADTLYK